MGESEYHWLVIRTEPNREVTGAAGLTGHGIRSYFPQIRKSEHHGRGSLRSALRPMFCGYLFAYSSPADPSWARLYNLPGLRGPLRLGVGLAIVTQAELQILRDTEARLLDFKSIQKLHDYEVGEIVRLKDASAFAGQLTTIDRLDDDGRITVLMSLFARQVPKVVTSDQIERV